MKDGDRMSTSDTIAALATLEKAAVRSAFIDAVKAAAKRSKELSGD